HPHGGPWCCLHSLRASANNSTRRDRPLRLPCPPPLAPRGTDNSLVLLGFHLYGPRHARSDLPANTVSDKRILSLPAQPDLRGCAEHTHRSLSLVQINLAARLRACGLPGVPPVCHRV